MIEQPDGGFGAACSQFALYQGVGAIDIIAGGYVRPGYVLTGALVDVRYYVPGTEPHGADLADHGLRSQFTLSVAAAPEPATLALTVGGRAVLGAGAWRRRTPV